MTTMAEETKLIEAAGAELRKRGLAGTPQRIERVVNAARPTVSVAEVTAGVNALAEKLDRQFADPTEGRRVVALHLEPRRPDGGGGAVVKTVAIPEPGPA